ncbi:MAG: M28 family metallopeptidase [Candidatus Hodarchaeales archaeon]
MKINHKAMRVTLFFLLLLSSILLLNNQVEINSSASLKKKSTISFGPTVSEFHTLLPYLMNFDRDEGIMHYQNLVRTLSEDFPNRDFSDPLNQSINNQLAIEWFRDTLLNFTNSKVQPLPGQSSLIFGSYKNVVGVLPAAIPTSTTILIGGHIDSVLGTPGADDNASGTSAVLEIARYLTDLNWTLQTNIIFCAFNREEQGFHGSNEIANYITWETNYDLMLVANFDMLLNDDYHSLNTNGQKINLGYDSSLEYASGSYWGDLFQALSMNYGLDYLAAIPSDNFTVILHDAETPVWHRSDQQSFAKHGIPSVFLIERVITNLLHTQEDTWDDDLYNYEQAFEAFQSTLAVILYTNEFMSRYNGIHIQVTFNETDNSKYELTTARESVIAIRSWNTPSMSETPFTIMQGDQTLGTATWSANNLSYWNDTLSEGNYTIEINEKALELADMELVITMGYDSNSNELPDIWENSFGTIGAGDMDDDNDGLSNYEEFVYNLDPLTKDNVLTTPSPDGIPGFSIFIDLLALVTAYTLVKRVKYRDRTNKRH